MPSLLNWLKSISTRLFDPEQDSRITGHANKVERRLAKGRDSFDLRATFEAFDISASDRPLVAKRVYRQALERVWRDRKMTDKERAGLEYIAAELSLRSSDKKKLDHEASRDAFRDYLAVVISDGEISDDETRQLNMIASETGSNTRTLVRHYFAEEGEGLLRGLVANMAESGRFQPAQLEHLRNSTRAMGYTDAEFQKMVRPPARRCAVHILADAHAVKEICATDRESLLWLARSFGLGARFQRHIKESISELQTWAELRNGTLPRIESDDPVLRAGETVHVKAHARYEFPRRHRDGRRLESLVGNVMITDLRLVFSSMEKSFEVRHSRVLELNSDKGGFELRTSGSGAGWYRFGELGQLFHAIYRATVGKSNQMWTERRGGDPPSRHIPRDVRQRVWQQYGGVCVDCRADENLQFDHIVPLAKGGSNAESNIQLLCQKCNLRKSAHI